MNARRDAASRILVAVVVTMLCYVWPAVGGALVAGLTAACVRPGRA